MPAMSSRWAAAAIALLLLALVPLRLTHATGTYTYWFPWYDSASPGMSVDNIHVVDPNASPANVSITLPDHSPLGGQIGPYGEQYWSWPSSIGGPVEVTSDQPVNVSQRVTYGLSFNEYPALPSTSAGKSFWFPWYDKASPGILNDNIHLVNPGPTNANVTATLGHGFVFQLTVNAQSATYHSFPAGQIGGPVHITSDQPILVSQRVQWNQSFNEIAGIPDSAMSTFNVINWYDQESPGYFQDDLHFLNIDPAQTAQVTVHYAAGGGDRSITVAPQSETWTEFPNTIGGPVTITSTPVGVAVTQRVNYWNSFKEYRALQPSDATKDAWFNWYDNASTCFVQNNIHLYTSGHSVGTITLGNPAKSMPFDVTGEGYFSFPLGTIGGPVHISVATGYDAVYPESRTVRCPPPPPPPPPPPVPRPTHLRIPGLGCPTCDMAVEEVGLDGSGNMGVPSNVYDAAWFDQMPRPGDQGDAVLTGHLDWTTTSCAAFCFLPQAWVGMDLYVDREDGSTIHFVVDQKNYYDANSPPSWLYTTSGSPHMSLITCGGDYIPGYGYTKRLVVLTRQV